MTPLLVNLVANKISEANRVTQGFMIRNTAQSHGLRITVLAMWWQVCEIFV
jgi:hypothetical protein